MAAGESLEPPARPRKRSGKRMRDLREQQKSLAEGDARHRLVKLQMDLQKTTNLLEGSPTWRRSFVTTVP